MCDEPLAQWEQELLSRGVASLNHREVTTYVTESVTIPRENFTKLATALRIAERNMSPESGAARFASDLLRLLDTVTK